MNLKYWIYLKWMRNVLTKYLEEELIDVEDDFMA